MTSNLEDGSCGSYSYVLPTKPLKPTFHAANVQKFNFKGYCQCYTVTIIIITIHQELGLYRPVSACLTVFSWVFQLVFVHLVYNSVLFLASCCSFLLNILVSLICNFLVFRQLGLLSSLPKFIHSFCGHNGYTWLFFRKFSSQLKSIFFFLSFFLRVHISRPYKIMGR